MSRGNPTRLSPLKDKVQQKQEAQLSQRDHAMLRVIEHYVKSLKVIRNDTLQYGVCKSVLGEGKL